MWTLKVSETVHKKIQPPVGGSGHSHTHSSTASLSSLLAGIRKKKGEEEEEEMDTTRTHTYKTRMLILSTGKHCTATIPQTPTDGSVPVMHSSQVGGCIYMCVYVYVSYFGVGGVRWACR